jgi:hypothetical protein
MTTREEIKNLVAYMILSFSNYHPDVDSPMNVVDVFLDLLGDLPLDALKAAVRSCCAEPGRQFAPSAGEIRGAVIKLNAQASGLPSAGEAWGAVVASFERMPGGNMAGGGHNAILDNPLVVEAVQQMGGYGAIGTDFFDNQVANRAHFLKLYNALYEHELSTQLQLPVVKAYIEGQREETKLLEKG